MNKLLTREERDAIDLEAIHARRDDPATSVPQLMADMLALSDIISRQWERTKEALHDAIRRDLSAL